jgi:hypothetical protein
MMTIIFRSSFFIYFMGDFRRSSEVWGFYAYIATVMSQHEYTYLSHKEDIFSTKCVSYVGDIQSNIS